MDGFGCVSCGLVIGRRPRRPGLRVQQRPPDRRPRPKPRCFAWRARAAAARPRTVAGWAVPEPSRVVHLRTVASWSPPNSRMLVAPDSARLAPALVRVGQQNVLKNKFRSQFGSHRLDDNRNMRWPATQPLRRRQPAGRRSALLQPSVPASASPRCTQSG